ncbi:hypothetical protein SK128_004634 [Halocaridina rubra]|uniref:Uncharacterized protein n=1 Tax=Halocaridina rubra TaxID=373956 RepID=A0AAN9A1J8_HALRR
MRLYTPAKPSSSTGEDGRRQQQKEDSLLQHQDNNNNKSFNIYDSRSAELTRRPIENNDHRPDDKLQINTPRIDDNTQPNHPRLDDKLLLNGPLPRIEQTPPTNVVDVTTTPTSANINDVNDIQKKSPTTVSPHRNNAYPGTEVINGIPESVPMMSATTPTTTQNGPTSLDYSSPPLENGTDSLRSLDSIPWNLDGTETIIENGSKSSIKNGFGTSDEDELKKIREENKKLKAALDEAAEVNGQWRQYHDERQGYVQRLLTTIHELQHTHSSTAPSPRQVCVSIDHPYEISF